ncbi:MAG TPA: isochorismatase family cysteine hydrolase [Candidatus Limnocylindria bacterium]
MAHPTVPTSLAEIAHPAHTALVVWDMQAGIGAKAHNIAQLLPTLRSLLASARAAGVLVIWSRHVAPPLDLTTPSGLWSLMKRQQVNDRSQLKPTMQIGTPDVEIIAELDPRPGEPIIEKSTPSFFVGTPLELRLRAHGITTLVLTGVSTEQGIEMTARHGLTLGFFAVVAEDAVGSFSAAAHELGLAYLRTAVDVVPAAQVAEAWGASSSPRSR